MTNDTKMLQLVLDKVTTLDQKVDAGFKNTKEEIKENRRRIDKLGIGLAEFSGDAPTIKDFEKLEKDFKIFKHQYAS